MKYGIIYVGKENNTKKNIGGNKDGKIKQVSKHGDEEKDLERQTDKKYNNRLK